MAIFVSRCYFAEFNLLSLSLFLRLYLGYAILKLYAFSFGRVAIHRIVISGH